MLPSARWGRSACWRGRPGSTTGGFSQAGLWRLIYRAARGRRGFGVWHARLGRCGSSRGGRRRLMALVLAPRFLGKVSLAADGEILVTIGHFGNQRPRSAGLGLGHQSPQLGLAHREIFPLALELLAIPQLVFGRIGKGGGRAVVVADADASG